MNFNRYRTRKDDNLATRPSWYGTVHLSTVTGTYCNLLSSSIFKGIVSRVWEQLQWHPSDRSEEFRITGAYFYSLLIPFSCFNSKKTHYSGFSFDSYSANEE